MVLRMPDLSAAASCRCACTFEYRPSNAASSPSLYPHLPPSLYSSFPPLLPSTLISHPPSTFPLLSSDHILCGTGVPPPVETARSAPTLLIDVPNSSIAKVPASIRRSAKLAYQDYKGCDDESKMLPLTRQRLRELATAGLIITTRTLHLIERSDQQLTTTVG